MKHKIAYEYIGYLMEKIIAVDKECDQLDMTLQTEHYWSAGYLERIESVGMKSLYRIEETPDLPEWVDVKLYYEYSPYRSSVLEIMKLKDANNPNYDHLARRLHDDIEIKAYVALLKVKNFRSNFFASLRSQLEQWLNEGWQTHDKPFSYRQLECIISAYHIR